MPLPSLLELAGAWMRGAAFFAIAFGSNLPAYGTAGDAGSSGEDTVGEAAEGDAAVESPFAFSSISARSFLVPPAVASFSLSLSFCSCFFFHAANLANRSAFLSASVFSWACFPFVSCVCVSGLLFTIWSSCRKERTSTAFPLDASAGVVPRSRTSSPLLRG